MSSLSTSISVIRLSIFLVWYSGTMSSTSTLSSQNVDSSFLVTNSIRPVHGGKQKPRNQTINIIINFLNRVVSFLPLTGNVIQSLAVTNRRVVMCIRYEHVIQPELVLLKVDVVRECSRQVDFYLIR